MAEAPLPPPFVAPATAPPAPRIGRPRDVLLLILLGLLLLLSVQFAALSLWASLLRESHPGLPFHELLRMAVRKAEYNALFAVLVQTALYVLLAAFIALRVRRVAAASVLATLAWRPLPSGHAARLVVGGLGLAIVIQLGTAIFPPPETLPIDKLISTRLAALLVLGASLLVAPFFEELIFRGYLYGLLEPAWGTSAAVVVTGILFGLLHAPQLAPGWVQIGFLCLVGLTFSLIRAKTGSLRASFLMHLAYNATIAGLFLAGPDFAKLPAAGGTLLWSLFAR